MVALATLDELKDRLDWTLDEDEERVANQALDDASNLARFYGAPWDNPATVPPLVKTFVLRACKRYMDNPQTYVQSRAADETIGWNDRLIPMGAPDFLDSEIAIFRALAGYGQGLVSVPITAWGPTRKRPRGLLRAPGECEGYDELGWVSTDRGKQFPLYPSSDGPW